MNQPIQENKEECNYCKLPHDTSMVCKPYVDSVVNPPQNTSREEIRERWNTSYLRSESRIEKDSQNFWDAIAAFWLAEIEATEKKTKEEFVKALIGTEKEEIFNEGRQSAFSQVREMIEKSDVTGIVLFENESPKLVAMFRKFIKDLLSQLQESSK